MQSVTFRFLMLATASLFTLAGWSSAQGASEQRVGDFALLDHNGAYHQLSYYGDQSAVVLLSHSSDAPASVESVAELASVQETVGNDAVVYLLINAQGDESRAAIGASTTGHGFPVLLDTAQLVARSLQFTRIAEAVIIDPKTMTVVYRGASDAAALSAVLAQMVVSEPVVAAAKAASGPSIAYPQVAAAKPVSYTKDIVPILTENCVSCHHDGGIGPWSMSNHAMVRGWSAMMREVVMTRRMPPGQIDGHVGKPLQEVAGLSALEQQKLIAWIDAGAPFDGDSAADPLAALTFENPKYSLGEPDMIFRVPPQAIPATGVIDYRYVPVELNLDRDVWVQAMEFVPGDRQVLHHVIAYVSSPADKTVRGRETGAARGESVGGFAPGRQPDAFRDNSGRLLPKGSNLLLQMHYTTSGKETVDATEIGLFLHDKPPAYVMAGGVAGQRRFLIPPHAKEHKLRGEQLIERDAYLYSMTPHMHFRGKYMQYTAEYPDGSTELLLSVPKYDFNWQFSYELQEPLFLPAGSKLIAEGAMDNSDRNPGNPDPTKPVHFGLQTKHEMFFGFTTLRYEGDTPETASASGSDTSGASAGQ